MKRKSKHQTPCRLRTGDQVMIMTGKSKGETGKIDRLDLNNGLVYVAGCNISLKHTKPTGNGEGGIFEKVMPLAISNVQILDPKTKKPTRIGYKVEGKTKTRFAKGSGAAL